MERSDNGDERFKCTGKEKDAETDFNYFGARYYDAGVSVWLSVDPMAGEYPSISALIYCDNNPIIYNDPDGMRINWLGSRGIWKYRKAMRATPEGRRIWKDMKKQKSWITIYYTDDVQLTDVGSESGYAIIEGFHRPYGEYEKTRGKWVKTGFKSHIIFVSMGAYNLRNEAKEHFSVDDLGSVDYDNLVSFYEERLNSGDYNVVDKIGNDIKLGGIHLASLENPDEDFIETPPKLNETQFECAQRVSGHEGNHAVMASYHLIESRKTNRPSYYELQEREAYKSEARIVKFQIEYGK